MNPKEIIILGAGPWGHALCKLLLHNNYQTTLWARSPESVNLKFKNKDFNYSFNLEEIIGGEGSIIVATPVSSLKNIGQIYKASNSKRKILLACKGIDSKNAKFPTEIFSQFCSSENLAVLSGPSFAKEVLLNNPTAVTIASTNKLVSDYFIKLFHSEIFRVYESDDLIGVQLGGAMKNILAIAAGISDGLSLGPNAKSAIITRGMAEIILLGDKLNCNLKTLYGLSGLGDLSLTCHDKQSRNFQFGVELTKNSSVIKIQEKIKETIEGVYAVDGIMKLCEKHNIVLPICSQVYNVVHGKVTPEIAVNELLSRNKKSEI